MEIVMLKVSDLTPYNRNTRKHNKKQIANIVKSIEKMGFNDPIAVWSEKNIIVEGHGRLEAAVKLGMDEVPCIRLDHLTDAQRREYAILHNKIPEQSKDDLENLALEIPELDFSGFDLGLDFLPEEKTEREPPQFRIQEQFHIPDFDETRTGGYFEMPKLKPVDFVPTRLLGFKYAKQEKEFNWGVHFYIDDYQFERLWNNFEKYVDLLKKFECVLTPHFSVYADMAKPVKIYNTYRGRLLGQMMQDRGIVVIPTVYWGDKASYDYAFEGLPENSTLSIYTMNYNASEWAHEIKRNGLIELLKRKHPARLLIYGNGIKINDVDFGDCETIYYTNEITKRWGKK